MPALTDCGGYRRGGSFSPGGNGKGPFTGPFALGAGTRSRTRDLLITNQLLYQLSYAGVVFQLTLAGVANYWLFVPRTQGRTTPYCPFGQVAASRNFTLSSPYCSMIAPAPRPGGNAMSTK